MSDHEQHPDLPTTFDLVQRLTRDVRAAASTLSSSEARFIVDYYYTLQEDRIRALNQAKQLTKSGEPHGVVQWLGEQAQTLEAQLKRALDAYGDAHRAGRWAKSITGIGPVIAAGLLAHVDITRCPAAGNLWSFAGLNPTATWEKGQKRPWNARLKTLTWKIGESFVKVSSNDKDYYGRFIIDRKALEVARNLEGAYADEARRALSQKNYGDDTDAKVWYSGRMTREDAEAFYATPPESRGPGLAAKLAKDRKPGEGLPMLPPAHVHARAKRYAVKLFLSHYHHVAWHAHYGEPPKPPYIVTHAADHVHHIVPPNWPID